MVRHFALRPFFDCTVTLNSRGYFDIHAKLSRASKRYFRFFGAGEPASRTAKAVKR